MNTINKQLKDVEKFHKLTSAPIKKTLGFPDKDRVKLRLALLKEELRELEQAVAESDYIEAADALVDLDYVLKGTVLEFGLQDKYDELWDEVQRSNMTKSCTHYDEAKTSQMQLEREKGVKVEIEDTEVGFVVKKASDGKVLKPITFSNPDLESIIYSK